jgi:hypothetical protein
MWRWFNGKEGVRGKDYLGGTVPWLERRQPVAGSAWGRRNANSGC